VSATGTWAETVKPRRRASLSPYINKGAVSVFSVILTKSTCIACRRSNAASTSAGLLRATEEVAQWVSGQLALAELDASRTRLMEAEVRALRAQISPHFIYNSLSAIASFVRTDPDRARELLLEFADFTRYSFRQHGAFTTLAEELRSIERYLMLERARFGDRLSLRLQVAPEVLPVTIPFLCLQPLVENAVRHGLEGKAGGGTITIMARDLDSDGSADDALIVAQGQSIEVWNIAVLSLTTTDFLF